MSFPSDSVGLVTPQKFQFEQPLELECGRILPRFDLMVETYGTLNADKSNAILICHALSGHHHAAGYHHADDKKAGWWDSCIGPGKAIDTNHFFIVSLNNIGGAIWDWVDQVIYEPHEMKKGIYRLHTGYDFPGPHQGIS